MGNDEVAQRAYEAYGSPDGAWSALTAEQQESWRKVAEAVRNPTAQTTRYVAGQNPNPALADADGNPLNPDGTPIESGDTSSTNVDPNAVAAAKSTGQPIPQPQETTKDAKDTRTAQDKHEDTQKATTTATKRGVQDDAEAGYRKK